MCSKLKDIIPNMRSSELKQKMLGNSPDLDQSLLEDYIPVSLFKPIGTLANES